MQPDKNTASGKEHVSHVDDQPASGIDRVKSSGADNPIDIPLSSKARCLVVRLKCLVNATLQKLVE